jgi:autotransporter-associated beta strand protein
MQFYNDKNEWESFSFRRYNNQSYAPSFSAYAIPENSYINHKNRNTDTFGFNISGDQKFKYLTSSTPTNGYASIKATAPSTVTLGSEVEWTGKQNSTAYLFEGSLSLVYLPEQNESEWKIESGSSTMNGSITVSKGIFSIAKTATFKNVPSICVSAEATFNLGNSTNALKGLTNLELGAGARFNASEAVTPFADNKITFDVAQDSVIEISPDLELSALVFKVNGTPIKGGGWYTGQDNPSPGNATPLAQLSGTGKIYLPLQVAEETASSWNGEGGENERMGNAANWAGNILPDLTSGGFLPTFVESGTNVIVDGAYILRGLYLTAPESILTISSDPSIPEASLALHKDGIEIASPQADETCIYELKTTTKLLSNQCWTVPEGTSLDVYEPIIADHVAKLYKDGAGDLNLYATNTFTGDMIISNGAVRVYSETNAFGAAGGTVTLRQRNGATLNILTNTVIDKDFVFSNEKDKNGWVKMKSGTVCKFLRSFTCSNNWRPDFGSGATVIFGGGGNIESFFVPAGGNMIFAGKPFSFGAGFNLQGGSIDFQVGGNTFHNISGYTINGGHTSFLSAENVFESTTPVILGGANNAECTLSIRNGANQRMGNLKMSKANSVVTAVEPAELTVNLTENITWAGNFTGGLTLIKDGAMTGTIDRVVGSTGDVHVVSGALVFGANGSWLGAKKVVVSDAVLSLSNKDTFASTIILETSGNAVIEIPEGVDIKVAEWIHNGTPCAPNYYAAANGKGVVSGSGTMLVGMPALMILIK